MGELFKCMIFTNKQNKIINMIKNFYLKDDDFTKEVNQDIVYGFFTRQGGVSKSEYNSLNCSFKNGINEKMLKKIEKLFAKNLI